MTRDLTKHTFETLYSDPKQISDFYKISLNDAKLYRRVSAYFSNDVFKFLKKGLPEFVKHDGYFQLVLSKEIKADTIVNALGSKKNIFVEENIHIPFAYIGDCSGERTADIASAVRSAYQAANAID